MKRYKIHTFALAAVLLTACSNEEPGGNVESKGEMTPISATAIAPQVAGSGSMTKALPTIAGLALSNLTLYYPTAGTNTLTTFRVLDDKIAPDAVNSKQFSFTTDGDATPATPIKALYWQNVADKGLKDADFYLTLNQIETVIAADAISSGNPAADITEKSTLWAKAEHRPKGLTADSNRPELAFGTLKNRFSSLRLVIQAEIPGINPSQLQASIHIKPQAAGDDVTKQAYPVDMAATTLAYNLEMSVSGPTGANGVTPFLAWTLVAPQEVPTSDAEKQLTITYGSYSWILDLSTITVTRPADSDYSGTAFGYNAGERITLTIKLALANLMPGSPFTITDYTAETISGELDAKP